MWLVCSLYRKKSSKTRQQQQGSTGTQTAEKIQSEGETDGEANQWTEEKPEEDDKAGYQSEARLSGSLDMDGSHDNVNKIQ